MTPSTLVRSTLCSLLPGTVPTRVVTANGKLTRDVAGSSPAPATQLIRVCAHCFPPVPGRVEENVTHGMCKRHAQEFLAGTYDVRKELLGV